MLHIHDTVSLCDVCYRHIPAIVYEEDGIIKMYKVCHEHGEQHSIVEIDPEFYYSLDHRKYVPELKHILFEASDRCQLNCPHCYHLPDNKIKDKPIDLLLDRVRTFPQDCTPMIAGAEPTLRPDFVELCQRLREMNHPKFSLLTNGLKFASKTFTRDSYNAGLKHLAIGLNHPNYQGQRVHDKQLKAIDNLKEQDYYIAYVGYTMESLDEVPFILEEIDRIGSPHINHFRLRCGSFIGRSGDQHRSYLSSLFHRVRQLLGNDVKIHSDLVWGDDNPYHIMISWGNHVLRLIQWPDKTNIDMEELATGPWCQFYDGPITNFVHQTITRDAFINNGLPMLDHCPIDYQYRDVATSDFVYWKHRWSGTTLINKPSVDHIKIDTKKCFTLTNLEAYT